MRLLLAALLLLPALSTAQDSEITVLCDESEDGLGYFFSEIIVDNSDLGGQYVAGGPSNQGAVPWGDTTGLLPPGITGEIAVAESPGGTILTSGAVSDPDEACEPISNPDAVAGKIALIRHGACAFSLKADYAQMAGAVGFIVYMDERDTATDFTLVNMAASDDPEGTGVGSGPDVTIPGLFLARFLGEPMRELIQDFDVVITGTIKYAPCSIHDDDWPLDSEGSSPLVQHALGAPSPNPFTHATRLVLTLAHPQRVRVTVYDVFGREVARLHDGVFAAGDHTLTFDAAALSAGTYLVRVTGETFSYTRRAVLTR